MVKIMYKIKDIHKILFKKLCRIICIHNKINIKEEFKIMPLVETKIIIAQDFKIKVYNRIILSIAIFNQVIILFHNMFLIMWISFTKIRPIIIIVKEIKEDRKENTLDNNLENKVIQNQKMMSMKIEQMLINKINYQEMIINNQLEIIIKIDKIKIIMIINHIEIVQIKEMIKMIDKI